MKDDKIPFLQSLQALAPHLNATAKKELDALVELTTLFRATSVAELKTALVKQRKAFAKTPEGFAARVADFKNGVAPDFGEPDAVETLVADFRKATGTTVKLLAKKFEIELVDKNDADAFERWLRTGVKPPTVEERLREKIEPEINAALELRDRSRRELAPETIERIMLVAERVKTTYKLPGLKLFMRGIDVVPTSKSAPAMLKELRRFLDVFAVNRFKATQIRDANEI